MYHDNIMNLIGKEVEVMASGMAYRGRLIEISESEVFLQSDLGWIQLATETVTSIEPIDD